MVRTASARKRGKEDSNSWGQTKEKSALQWEVKTEELGFRCKFCLMKLNPSLLAAQLAETGLRRKGKVFVFDSG